MDNCDCGHDHCNGTPLPLIGDPFPALEVVTTHGKLKLPEAFAGQWFILFSHPADFTPVCTTEFVAFQKRYPELKALNAALIGLSVDQVFAHLKWIQWIKENLGVEIQFPIIADSGNISSRLGLIHPGKGTNTVRAVFFVDPQGTIRAILYYPQELGRNLEEIVRMLRGFQTADANGVAIPADWPHNELVGDEVIVPPANTVESAEKRMKQYTCYDWWFCHRKLEK